jgi:hypothetical protein
MLAHVRAHMEINHTIVRLDNGIFLMPRKEVEVDCDLYDTKYNLLRLHVIFAPGAELYIEASPTEVFEDALRAQDFDTLNRVLDGVKLAMRDGRVELSFAKDHEDAPGLHYGSCTVELTADAWTALRDKMLEAIAE